MGLQYEIAEAVSDWLRVNCPALPDRIEMTREFMDEFREHGLHRVVQLLDESIDRDECLEYGVCPICGGPLERIPAHEEHPYGATVAVEERWILLCPEHGEV